MWFGYKENISSIICNFISMKIRSIFLVLFFGAASCSVDVGVDHVGNLMDVMQGTDISAKIDLKTLQETPNLYAVGALENLRGEILILNGDPFISTFNNALLVLDKNWDYQATLLIYSEVNAWSSIVIPESITDWGGLEDVIGEIAGPYGLKGKPFPFLVEGIAKKAGWHVVNGSSGGNHKEGGVKGEMEDEYVTIVGFYSENHEGVFTHRGSSTHAHVLNEKRTMSGHLDFLELGKGMVLKVPK